LYECNLQGNFFHGCRQRWRTLSTTHHISLHFSLPDTILLRPSHLHFKY
jgi:hypothetical protein